MKGSERPTILSVAKLAGVSRAAVSKVLRNQYGVSTALRARVEDAVRELNYRPLASARALRGRGQAIGIVMQEIANPFFPEILDGVAKALNPEEYQTFLGIGHFQDAQQERMVETMLDRQMDGLILVAPSMPLEAMQRFVGDIPTVAIGYSSRQATGFDTVNSEDDVGAALVVRHFHALGHRDIAIVTSDESLTEEHVGRTRQQGYVAAMRALGLTDHIRICHTPLHAPDVPAPVMDLLSGKGRPTAVFASSDGYALHVYNAADQLNLSVPGDLALAGYDDSWICSVAPLSLTSVQQSGLMLGTKAVDLLMERIRGRTSAVHLELPPKLIVRRSSGSGLG